MIKRHMNTIACMVALFALVVATIALLLSGKFATMLLCIIGAAMLAGILHTDYRKCQEARKRKILLG